MLYLYVHTSYAGPYLPIILCLNMCLHQVKQIFRLANTSISREGHDINCRFCLLDFKRLGFKWTNLPFLLLNVHTLDSIKIKYVMKNLHLQYGVNKGQMGLRMYSYNACCLSTYFFPT